LSTIFGTVAALLAAVGLYGVIAYSVARRTREIGLRVALGAGRGQIQWLVMREVLVLIGAGVALGIPAALAVTRLAKNMLFGVAPNDPATLAGAALLMGAIALLAVTSPRVGQRKSTRWSPLDASSHYLGVSRGRKRSPQHLFLMPLHHSIGLRIPADLEN